jgi:hypothetical protein
LVVSETTAQERVDSEAWREGRTTAAVAAFEAICGASKKKER